MKNLNPFTIPLNQASLIEASAGTGKTYTMANLYLRLVLGIDCNPLNVEQILVVTFTKAATQELRDRIRAKLARTAEIFQKTGDELTAELQKDDLLNDFYKAIQPKLSEALLRLRIAERNMDVATIFTIDSFCQKMLFQYAFDSGVRFDIQLETDESELLQRLSEESWRELFYPASLEETKLVADLLGSPAQTLGKIWKYLSEILPAISESQQAWLAEDYTQQAAQFSQFFAKARAYWKENYAETISPLQTAFARQNDEGVKILNGTSYKQNSFENKWLPTINSWAEKTDWSFPAKELSYFTQSLLEEKASKGAEVLRSPHFVKWDEFCEEYQQFGNVSQQIETKLLYRYFTHLRQKLADYKAHHLEKNFSDMVNYFHQALQGENGKNLAEKIRQQFHFAMIDESQDTNQTQYQIFKRIFIDVPKGVEQGFIMIGDPKQSIYKFRGADIFAYLEASEKVTETFTLSRNWRSLPDVVNMVNQLFTMPADQPPFLYPEINFSPVEPKQSSDQLLGEQHSINFYYQPNGYNTALEAEQCAEQICQQLNNAQGQLFVEVQDENGIVQKPLEPKDIAILVRSHSEAAEIKRSLAKRNLQSVYLSEKQSVFASQEASDLELILKACLNPFSQKTVLTALGTPLWGLSSDQIFEMKHDELKWEQCVADFSHYHQLWQTQGVLPMLHQLFMQQNIVARINGKADTGRRLTNILHLAELLQEKMETAENEATLLRWFMQQIENPKDDSDGQVLRLESEADLIKIVTIHKSKGLEYPVVWLPFVAKNAKGAGSETMSLYRNKENKLEWDFNSGDEEIASLRNKAEYAEDLRLLYVALTRAKFQLHLVLPEKWGNAWNAMHYLLGNGKLTKDANSAAYIDAKLQGLSYQAVTLAEEITTSRYEPKFEQAEQVVAKEFTGKIRETGTITSFTALHAQSERLQNSQQNSLLAMFGDDAQDYDKSTIVQNVSELLDETDTFSPYQFPHSTKVGNLLHRFFELLDFSQPIDLTSIQTLCEQLGLDDAWHEPVKQWFEQILQTPFGDKPFSLSQTNPQKRLNEWQFYLRLTNRSALPKLNHLLKKEGRLAPNLPDLQLFQLDGFVRGFVDCIVEVDNKFYVIDYKSNFLGYLAQDYSPEKIEKTMGQYRYDLQYLLYTLAVHRYLGYRLGENYDYERDFGGVAYLFLRGMNGTENSGVYFDKPSKALIEGMDQLFG